MKYKSDRRVQLARNDIVEVPAYKMASLVSDLWKNCMKNVSNKSAGPIPSASGLSPLKTKMISTRALYSGKNENEAYILDVRVDRCKGDCLDAHNYCFVLSDGRQKTTLKTRVIPEVKAVQWSAPLSEEIPH
mmetsp:Transcript_16952/g.35586  ORF Transcript_16952/g.35586 Transcript_16952/m.35586 type:complete len:132 (+) Transcript_16952:131-526(+)